MKKNIIASEFEGYDLGITLKSCFCVAIDNESTAGVVANIRIRIGN